MSSRYYKLTHRPSEFFSFFLTAANYLARHCVLQGRLLSLKQDPTHLHYQVTWPNNNDSSIRDTSSQDDTVSLLHNYFALSHSLSSLYEKWTASDANFARRAPAFTGIRILNQDAWETLVAFICSSNNNISRISQMVHKLCIYYGPYITSIDGEAFHDFPRPDALSGASVESHLRELGFGYRAKYIAETARIVTAERPLDWLLRLRNPAIPTLDAAERKFGDNGKTPTYKEAHEALLGLSGVGPKVADCVCLMGLGWGEAVPVDTHVWQIAQRDYNFGKNSGGAGKTKSFSKAMYDAVGDHFRKIWGPQAGWAQSVLFTANLKSFAEQATRARNAVVATAVEGGEAPVKAEMEQPAIVVVPNGRSKKRKVEAEVLVSKVEAETASGRRTNRRASVKINDEIYEESTKQTKGLKEESAASLSGVVSEGADAVRRSKRRRTRV